MGYSIDKVKLEALRLDGATGLDLSPGNANSKWGYDTITALQCRLQELEAFIDTMAEVVNDSGWQGKYFKEAQKLKAKPIEDCQSGRADICRAGAADGICCPDDSCDIDDEVRKDPTERQGL